MHTQNAKKAYSTPQLMIHGNVETLTLGGGNGHQGRPVGGGGGNGYGYGHCKHAGQNPGHMDDPLGGCGLS